MEVRVNLVYGVIEVVDESTHGSRIEKGFFDAVQQLCEVVQDVHGKWTLTRRLAHQTLDGNRQFHQNPTPHHQPLDCSQAQVINNGYSLSSLAMYKNFKKESPVLVVKNKKNKNLERISKESLTMYPNL